MLIISNRILLTLTFLINVTTRIYTEKNANKNQKLCANHTQLIFHFVMEGKVGQKKEGLVCLADWFMKEIEFSLLNDR